jgi:hypothetical protein
MSDKEQTKRDVQASPIDYPFESGIDCGFVMALFVLMTFLIGSKRGPLPAQGG